MTNRAPRLLGPPADFVDGSWEEGRFTASAPTAAKCAWLVSQRLAAAMGDRPKATFAAEVGVARSTVHDILTGRTWPDMVTLTRLEEVLDADLWASPADVKRLSGRRRASRRTTSS